VRYDEAPSCVEDGVEELVEDGGLGISAFHLAMCPWWRQGNACHVRPRRCLRFDVDGPVIIVDGSAHRRLLSAFG